MKVLDLFSGIGGFSLGLERAGMQTVAFCEIEEYPRKVLAKHWPDIPIYEDVRNVTKKRLFADGVRPDVICGGFPCQDISTAKTNNHINPERRGIEGERSGLWSECARLLGNIQPRYAIFENVSALLSGNGGRWFQRVLFEISASGYDAEWMCVRASDVGAQHERDRIWIIAYPNKAQLKRGGISSRIHQEYANISHPRWGKDKPGVDRMANGLPSQMDRLGCIGNAVVPQIPEIIGRAIMGIEND